MSERLPFLKFYPGDWMTDAALRTCSVAARGLWIDVLAAMHANTNRRGYLELPTGKPMLACHVARIIGATEQETEILLAELENAGVFSRTKDGTIYSRRMVRDDRQLQDDVKNGRRGGNPRLKGGVNPPVNPPLNPTANPPLKARSQKSEVRDQKSESDTSSVLPTFLAPDDKPKAAANAAKVPAGAKNLTHEQARNHPLPLTWPPELRDAFAKFIDQRYASSKRCTASAIDLLVSRVEDMPADKRHAAINQSIANGYQGIFLPKDLANGTGNTGNYRRGKDRTGEYAEPAIANLTGLPKHMRGTSGT